MKILILLLTSAALSGCLSAGNRIAGIGPNDNSLTLLKVDTQAGIVGASTFRGEGCIIIKRGTAPFQVEGVLTMEAPGCSITLDNKVDL